MKIAVLSDIHANLDALNVVLQYTKKHDIKHFIIAGDHITDGLYPNEVLDIIQSLNAWVIKGNREDMVIAMNQNDEKRHLNQFKSIYWTLDLLKPNNLDYIHSLSESKRIDFEDKDDIRVVHGSPFDIRELLNEEQTDRIEEILTGISEKILICGHIHNQWYKRVDNKLILNPGSVGLSYNDKCCAEFAIISWDDDRWLVKCIKEPYNLTKLKVEHDKRNIYETIGIWPRLTLDSLETGTNKNVEFIDEAIKESILQGYHNFDYIPNHVWDSTGKRYYNNL